MLLPMSGAAGMPLALFFMPSRTVRPFRGGGRS